MRYLVLSCVLAVSLLSGVLYVANPARAAATITVTTTSDLILDDGLCSLREAIIAANTGSTSGSLPGECIVDSGADTIVFSPSLPVPAVFVLTRAGVNEDAAATGDLDIQGTLTIKGAGVGNTIVDGNNADRVFDIHPTAQVTLMGMTIRNGNPGPGGNGGAVRNSGFTLVHLTLRQSAVISNTATSGAGVFNEGVGAAADIYDTHIGGNTATAAGGGVFNNGIMTVNGSTLDHNHARSGGGIEHFGGSLHLTNDTISSNTAGDNGGGLYNGAGVFLTNLTLYANTANGSGGGIFNDESNAYPVNTIIASNQAVDGDCASSEFAAVVSQGHNLDSDNTCSLSASGDITDANALLGPLQDNGGDTFTHALLSGSAAIDQGDDASCPATDQRGMPRPQGAACDIGAYEFGKTADLSIRKMRQGSGVVVSGGRITYTITITNAGPTAPITATLVDTWTPVDAVIGVHAPGCVTDLVGGVVTCTTTNLGLESVLMPSPALVFSTSAVFSGTLANSASVAATGGIADVDPDDNITGPVSVTVTSGEIPPAADTDLSINKGREDSGNVVAGERITFTLTVTNAGPASPVTVTVVDYWTPIHAVVGVDAPGCAIDLGGGAITCTRTGLKIGSAVVPSTYLVFTSSAGFSGTLANTARVAAPAGITDTNPDNDVSGPVTLNIVSRYDQHLYMPLVWK